VPRTCASLLTPSSSSRRPATVLPVMVLKEPAAISQRFYSSGGWAAGPSSLVIDAFRGILNGAAEPQEHERSPAAPERAEHAPLLRLLDMPPSALSLRAVRTSEIGDSMSAPLPIAVLSAPWATVSYASRGRAPEDLWQLPQRSDHGPGAGGGIATAEEMPAKFCAFMGHRRGRWRLGDRATAAIAPGYFYRDRLVSILNCTHLQPGDRVATHQGGAAAEPVQAGPFEVAVGHYTGFRFVVAVENTNAGAPVSEKVVNAFLAGAIPIVWGGGLHAQIFDPRSFVDCSSASVEQCAAQVLAVEASATLLQRMRHTPRFRTRGDFERFFSWSASARGSAPQRRLHGQLMERLRARVPWLRESCPPPESQIAEPSPHGARGSWISGVGEA
jgi:hypothetical protein